MSTAIVAVRREKVRKTKRKWRSSRGRSTRRGQERGGSMSGWMSSRSSGGGGEENLDRSLRKGSSSSSPLSLCESCCPLISYTQRLHYCCCTHTDWVHPAVCSSITRDHSTRFWQIEEKCSRLATHYNALPPNMVGGHTSHLVYMEDTRQTGKL
jgi:hypothetical protein